MKYLSISGRPLWSFEWNANGEPVLLLHGGLSDTDSFADVMVDPLQNSFHLFAYDRTGHGRSADSEGSFHFDFQRDEAIAFIDEIIGKPVHLIGYSDGANISFMVALNRPDLVKSIVAIAGNLSPAGLVEIPQFIPEAISEEDRAEYAATSPDAPETLDIKVSKMHKIWASEPNLEISQISKIAVPVLVMAGDDDVVKHSHSLDIYENLQFGQLAIIPGTSHGLVKEKPGLVTLIIKDFLQNQGYPVTRQPIRRVNPI